MHEVYRLHSFIRNKAVLFFGDFLTCYMFSMQEASSAFYSIHLVPALGYSGIISTV